MYSWKSSLWQVWDGVLSLGTFLNLTAILTSDMETFLGLIDTKTIVVYKYLMCTVTHRSFVLQNDTMHISTNWRK